MYIKASSLEEKNIFESKEDALEHVRATSKKRDKKKKADYESLI